MSSQFLSLEDAAKKLGITNERLVELRSQGKIRGFRDGASWKFPEAELDRLADELASGSDAYNPYGGLEDEFEELDSDEFVPGSGSGVLVDELDLGSGIGTRSSRIIGGDNRAANSDIGIGSEPVSRSGSDVNLIAGDSNGSDVKVVTGGAGLNDSDEFLMDGGPSDLVEIDSGELQLSPNEPAITHDSAVLDLAIEPNAGSTGPITDKELKEVAESHPDLMVGKKPKTSESSLAFDDDDEDSGEDLIGMQSEDDVIGSDLELQPRGSGASSLELMDDLDLISGSSSSNATAGRSSRGVDVLSELDLLSNDAGGSGLITGDSGLVLGSGIGSRSGTGSGGKGSKLDFDDALSDDDDLVIADDEDDLVLGGAASDVSVSGDSGINLMSPSDSGLSLESEPLDLAGSSISALDLGAELGSDVGSASGRSKSGSGRGSDVSFSDDEDFRLSPSAAGDNDADSNSQVIEIEDSAAFVEGDAFGEADAFGDAAFVEEGAEGGFGDEAVVADGFAEQAPEEEYQATTSTRRGAAPVAYEVPFSIFQVSMLMLTIMIMSVGGMLMTDLLRNMWAYTDTAAPVSSLTDSLISLAQLDKR